MAVSFYEHVKRAVRRPGLTYRTNKFVFVSSYRLERHRARSRWFALKAGVKAVLEPLPF